MKTFLAILLSFMTCATLVHAQATDDLGLSANKCQWKHVKPIFEASGPMWESCADATGEALNGCVYKFCSGPGVDKKWEKSQCNKYCITLQEELPIEGLNVKSISGDSGVDLVANYFGLWYKIGAVILGLIGVLVIVISGVQIIFGGASEEMVSGAKTRIWAAILSLILLFSSALILKTINPLFFT